MIISVLYWVVVAIALNVTVRIFKNAEKETADPLLRAFYENNRPYTKKIMWMKLGEICLVASAIYFVGYSFLRA
jgi:hypothetical protein